jgi:ubiquitin-conjugating enzyme E2 variant
MDMPRTFRLYEELEKYEKGATDTQISLGLDKADDKTFSDWNGTIVGPPNSKFDNRIYFLSVHTGDNYPQVAPTL